MTAPKMPEPAVMCDCGGNYFTADQMRAARREALEEAVKACEAVSRQTACLDGTSFYIATGQCAAAIRELSKEKDQ